MAFAYPASADAQSLAAAGGVDEEEASEVSRKAGGESGFWGTSAVAGVGGRGGVGGGVGLGLFWIIVFVIGGWLFEV